MLTFKAITYFLSSSRSNEIVLALFEGGWYRALVDDTEDNGIIVQYLEFGNLQIVSSEEVMPLPDHLKHKICARTFYVDSKYDYRSMNMLLLLNFRRYHWRSDSETSRCLGFDRTLHHQSQARRNRRISLRDNGLRLLCINRLYETTENDSEIKPFQNHILNLKQNVKNLNLVQETENFFNPKSSKCMRTIHQAFNKRKVDGILREYLIRSAVNDRSFW